MIIDQIDQALKRKKLSDAAASKLAVGHPSLIKNFRMQREGDKRYNLSSLAKLADVLGLELYFGPPREACSSAEPAGPADDVAVPRLDVDLGDGASVDGEPVIGHIRFPAAWLRRMGVTPAAARLVAVHGTSMLPTLRPGALVLVDTSRTDLHAGRVHALRAGPAADEGARIKRLWPHGPRGAVLTSDNPSAEFPPEVDPHARARITGLVVWTGHELADR